LLCKRSASDTSSIEDNELSKVLEKAQRLKDKRVELDAEIAACYEDIKRVGEVRRAHFDAEKALIAEAQTILSGSAPKLVGERDKMANWKSPPSSRSAPTENVILPQAHVAPDDGAETLN
jgi:uncharacterized protein (UPF0335 family)